MVEMGSGGGRFGARIWKVQHFLSHALLRSWVLKRKRGRLGSCSFFFPFQSHFYVGAVDLASPSQTIPDYISVLC